VAPHYVFHPAGTINAESCVRLMSDFRYRLLIMGTTKDGVPLDPIFWFSHSGYQVNPMPPNFAVDLAEHIVTVINLNNYPTVTNPEVKCEQPLIPLTGGPVSILAKDHPGRR